VATLRDIRRRIRGVTSTKQITRAMQMVATAKMRRAQARVRAARPYATEMAQVLATLRERAQEYRHPFLVPAEGTRGLLVLVTSDRGLCGALNVNTIRLAHREMLRRFGPGYQVVTVGRKGRDFARRNRLDIVLDVSPLPDRPGPAAVRPAARAAIDLFLAGTVQQVMLAFAAYRSTLVQEALVEPLIPVPPPAPGDAAARAGLGSDYIYEPDAQAVLDDLLPRAIESRVYQAVLENQASEWSARMVAMRSATDNADDLIRQLTLTANKVRQAAITRELMEIVSGAEALRAGAR